MGVLSCVGAVPGGKPFEPFGKDSIGSEGGSTGRRADWPCHIKIARKVRLLRPSVQLPAGIHGSALYKDFLCQGKGKGVGKHAVRHIWTGFCLTCPGPPCLSPNLQGSGRFFEGGPN